MLKLDRLTLEPRFIDRNICFCTGGSDPSDDDSGPKNQSRGTTFGVDGRSVTGSTAQDRAIGFTDGQGGKGANYDALSGSSSSDVRAAVDAANKAATSGGDTVQAAAGVVGGAGLDAYGIGSEGEFSSSAGAPAASAALANLSSRPTYDDAPIRFAQNQLGAGSRPDARITARPQPSRDLMTVFPGILGQSIFAGSQGRNEPIERNLALTALQDRAVAGDADAQIELDDLEKRGVISGAEARYAVDRLMAQNMAQVSADRVLNQAPSTPMDANEFAGSGIRSLPDTVYDSDMGMVGSRTSAPTGDLYGGYEDDAAYDADLFGTARYAGGITGLDGKLQGFEDVRKMGDFAETATRGGVLGKVTDYGIIPNVLSAITGQTPMDMRRGAVQEFFESGAQFNPESGKMELPAGEGVLKMGESGMVTYSGPFDPNYTGMYSNLVQGPSGGDDGGTMVDAQGAAVADPCPEGYKMVDGTCQPIKEAGSDFQIGAGVGDTRFSPFYSPQQVDNIDPFVLQPYAMGGLVQHFRGGGGVGRQDYQGGTMSGVTGNVSGSTTSDAASSRATEGINSGTGRSFSGAELYGNQNMRSDNNAVQSVMATPIQMESVIATPLVGPPPTNAESLVPVTNLQSRGQASNARIQQRIDSLRGSASQQPASSQPGLAKTLMEGAIDIFGVPLKRTADATVTGAQNVPQMNQNIEGQVGDVSKSGQIQAPALLESIVPSADQAVSGISQGQFTNVMPENQSSFFPTPEQFRANMGLPDDVIGAAGEAVGDFLSNFKQTILGNPNQVADNFKNLGELKDSSRLYGSPYYKQ